MRKLLVFVLALILTSCVEQKMSVPASLPIEKFYKSFMRENPNWQQNDIIYNEKMAEFKKAFDSTLVKENIICGIPLKIRGLNKNENLNLIIAHLGSWTANRDILEWEYGVDNVNVDVFAEIDETIVSSINDAQTYRLYGKFISRLETMGQIKFIYGENPHAVYSPSVRISRDIPHLATSREFNLGILYFKADSLVPINRQNARGRIVKTVKAGKVLSVDTLDII